MVSSLGVSGGLLQISQKGSHWHGRTKRLAPSKVPRNRNINNTVIYAVHTERDRESKLQISWLSTQKKHLPILKQSNPQLHLPMELSNLDCDSFGAEFIPRCLEVVDLRKCWLPGGCQNQLINQQTYKWIDLFVRKKSIKIEIPLYWTWKSGFLQLNTWPV